MSSSTFPVFPSPPSSTVDSTPSASSTDSSGDDGSGSTGGAANSSLYLFTFLATLFLLLFVSCAIILRSFILRRRFRQRVEAAILAGVLHPSHGIYLGSLHNFGEKPKMWDTWVAGTGGKEKNGWRDIMPVSVQPLFSSSSDPQSHSHSHSHTHRHAQDPSSQTFDSAYSSFSTRPLISRLNPFSRRSPSSASTETASSSDAPPPPTSPSDKNQQPDPQPEAMQVSVLIAMPSPHRPSVLGSGNGADMSLKGKARKPSTASWEYEEELPEMVFGVARQVVRR